MNKNFLHEQTEVTEIMRAAIEILLNKLPEVKWDRFTDSMVFGWIAREDGKHDFVVLFMGAELGGRVVFAQRLITSSAKYSAEFAARLGFGVHKECSRVERYFPGVTNSVKLDLPGAPPKVTDTGNLIEALMDVAMGVCHFDWDWSDETIPEVKYARDKLRKKFKEVLERQAQGVTGLC